MEPVKAQPAAHSRPKHYGRLAAAALAAAVLVAVAGAYLGGYASLGPEHAGPDAGETSPLKPDRSQARQAETKAPVSPPPKGSSPPPNQVARPPAGAIDRRVQVARPSVETPDRPPAAPAEAPTRPEPPISTARLPEAAVDQNEEIASPPAAKPEPTLSRPNLPHRRLIGRFAPPFGLPPHPSLLEHRRT